MALCRDIFPSAWRPFQSFVCVLSISVLLRCSSLCFVFIFDRSHFGSSTVLVLVPFHIDPQMYNHDLSFGVDQPAALRAQSGVKSALEVTIHPALEPSTNPAHCADLLSAGYEPNAHAGGRSEGYWGAIGGGVGRGSRFAPGARPAQAELEALTSTRSTQFTDVSRSREGECPHVGRGTLRSYELDECLTSGCCGTRDSAVNTSETVGDRNEAQNTAEMMRKLQIAQLQTLEQLQHSQLWTLAESPQTVRDALQRFDSVLHTTQLLKSACELTLNTWASRSELASVRADCPREASEASTLFPCFKCGGIDHSPEQCLLKRKAKTTPLRTGVTSFSMLTQRNQRAIMKYLKQRSIPKPYGFWTSTSSHPHVPRLDTSDVKVVDLQVDSDCNVFLAEQTIASEPMTFLHGHVMRLYLDDPGASADVEDDEVERMNDERRVHFAMETTKRAHPSWV